MPETAASSVAASPATARVTASPPSVARSPCAEGPAEDRRADHRAGRVEADDEAIHQPAPPGEHQVHALQQHHIGGTAAQAEERAIAERELHDPWRRRQRDAEPASAAAPATSSQAVASR